MLAPQTPVKNDHIYPNFKNYCYISEINLGASIAPLQYLVILPRVSDREAGASGEAFPGWSLGTSSKDEFCRGNPSVVALPCPYGDRPTIYRMCEGVAFADKSSHFFLDIKARMRVPLH